MAASIRSCVCRQLKSFTSIKYNINRFSTYVPIYSACFRHTRPLGVLGDGQHCDIRSSQKYAQTRPPCRSLSVTSAVFSSEQATEEKEDEKEDEKEEDYHSIIKNTERGKGPTDKREFQAETRKLLDIVAKSLYSEKEVFIRELISNASDALEKLRYLQLQGETIVDKDIPLEIHLATDENKKTFTIQDTGVGLTKEELIENIGTIAKSGSQAFIDEMSDKADVSSSLIGQFGVGFYSTFMVGDNVEVFTQSCKAGSAPLKWTSAGTGSYEVSEAEGVQRGTKIVVHLKGDCYDFAKEEIINSVVKKYSNFVGVPIFLNGKRINVIEALWMLDPKSITEDMHEEFYRFTTNSFDKPRYHLHYKADAPLNIRALFYIPEYKPTLFEMSRETDVALTLYSRKVMILQKANNILPKWLRFVKGVVDSEDIPLNLSRELLQDSALIRKLRMVLTNRILKFLLEQSKKDKDKYLTFYEDYGMFVREGIVTTMEQDPREDIARLMRFESSTFPEGVKVGLDEYTSRMKAGSREIYFLAAPNRHLAEGSPYYESLKDRDVEVLFLYEPYDELVLLNLAQFDKKTLKSIENEIAGSQEDSDKVDSKDENSLTQSDMTGLMDWMRSVLGNKVNRIKITQRLQSHPCIVTVVEMGSARHFLRTSMADKSPEERYRLLQPTLELNPSHPLIKKLNSLSTSDPSLATLLAEQLFENAMINAGLVDDTRSMVQRLHELLEKALKDK